MSVQLAETPPSGAPQAPEEILAPIKQRVEQGLRDRGRYEPTWHSNRAFAQGKFWLKWSRTDRRLMLDPADVENGRQRYAPDLLTQFLKTAEGHLDGAEDRHDLIFRRNDVPSEDFTKAANDGHAYAWEVETDAARHLNRTKRRIIVDGTAAVRARFDPTVGRDLGQVPVGDGQPISFMRVDEQSGGTVNDLVPTKPGQPLLNAEHARAYVAQRQGAGQRVQFKPLKEGRIVLEPGSVWNLVTPPGLEDEADFPWEAWIRACSIESLIALYGAKAQGLQSEPLAGQESMGARELLGDSLGASEQDAPRPGKLDGHVRVVTYYERPCSKYPKGRVVTYAGEKLLDVQNQLPLCNKQGDYVSGISYFHYWRVEGRFWGRGLIEAGKDIQRLYAKRASQEQETIDRSQPYVLAERESDLENPREIMQVLKYKRGTTPPQPVQPPGPAAFIQASKEGLLQDLERAMGIRSSELGDNPSNVNSYAQLALLLDQAKSKAGPIIADFQANVKRLEECVVWLMREFWPSDKMVALAGDQDLAEVVEFKAEQLPSFFLFKQAETTRPRSEAAELQLINDIYQDSLTSAAATGKQPLPLQWKVDSIAAGKPLPLPDDPADSQRDLAEWQNAQITERAPVQTEPWHDPAVHIPEHTELLIEAEMAGDQLLMAAVQQHIASDQALADQNLAEQQAAQAAQALAMQQQAGPQPPQQPPQAAQQ